MIRDSLGPSTLEENLGQLTRITGRRAKGSEPGARAAAWAAEALRRAGVDEVYTEKFPVPAGSEKGARSDLPNRAARPVESENIAGEIRGREKSGEFVLLGAPINSCNAAVVIDAARVIHRTGTIPRRSIRFVLFADDGQGMPGGRIYVQRHADELDRMVGAIVLDAGTCRITGFSLGGREDIQATVKEALEPAAPLGVEKFTAGAELGANNLDFLLEGVPTLVPSQGPGDCAANDHAGPGTPANGDIPQLKHNVAVAAIAAFALADRTARIGARQSRPEIEALLKETGLDVQMQRMGFWQEWESGARGRQP